jgi:hypothetical protein
MIVRRLRGIAGAALAWAVVWGIAGVVFASLLALWSSLGHGGLVEGTGRMLLQRGMAWGIWGALSGAVFATVLLWMERRRGIDDLSTARVAAWGALGGMALPTLMAVYLATGPLHRDLDGLPVVLLLGALLGAGCAAGSLALARQPERVSVPR